MPSEAQSAGGFETLDLTALGHRPTMNGGEQQLPFAALVAENRDLAAEVLRLRSERDRLAELQRRVMDLLNCQSADRIVHDLRNLLNERELFRSLAELD